MVTKTKTITTTVQDVAQHLGILLMTSAALVSSVDINHHARPKAAVLPSKPVFASASNDQNPLRREREETAPHFISYSEIQRTPGRAGKY